MVVMDFPIDSNDPFAQFPANVAVFDSNWQLLYCNQKFAHFVLQDVSGPERPLRTGENLLHLWPDAQRILGPFLQRWQAGEPMPAETVHIRRDQMETYWDVALLPREADDGRSQFLFIMYDVTTHIHAHQRLERQMADRMRKLKALYDVMQVASESLDLTSMVMQALRRVLLAVQARAGMVYLLDETDQHLHLVGHFGLTEAMESELTAVPADVGLAGLTLKKKAPIVVPNIQADENTRPIFRQSRLKSYVGVKMRVKGQVIGTVGAFWERSQSLLAEDIELLDSAADQIAVAIESHRLRQKAEQLAVMEERNRLARDLHDSVSQALYSMSLLAAAGRRLSRSGGHEKMLEETLQELGMTAQQALKEMRLLLYRLRPLALQFDSLAETLQHRLDAVEKRAGITTQLIVSDEISPLLPVIEETLFYIAQEALNNALKYAGATAVTVQLAPEADDFIQLVVTDNGRGFDLATALEQGGMGLVNMRQRAQDQGGTLTIHSLLDQGTTITARLHLRGEQ